MFDLNVGKMHDPLPVKNFKILKNEKIVFWVWTMDEV